MYKEYLLNWFANVPNFIKPEVDLSEYKYMQRDKRM